MRYGEYVICACYDNEVVGVEYEDGVREYLCDNYQPDGVRRTLVYAFRNAESALSWCQRHARACLANEGFYDMAVPVLSCTPDVTAEPEEEPVRQIVL